MSLKDSRSTTRCHLLAKLAYLEGTTSPLDYFSDYRIEVLNSKYTV
jgi:hypothetical protein